MKRTRFTETQIVGILKEYEAGKKVPDLCHEHGISKATFFNWKSKYGGVEVNELKRIKELEEENSRLKKMYAELSLSGFCNSLAPNPHKPSKLLRISVASQYKKNRCELLNEIMI